MKKILLKIIKIYQTLISPYFSKRCRFYPTCSDYAYHSIKEKGALRGGLLSFRRLLKCGPWNKGGIDMP